MELNLLNLLRPNLERLAFREIGLILLLPLIIAKKLILVVIASYDPLKFFKLIFNTYFTNLLHFSFSCSFWISKSKELFPYNTNYANSMRGVKDPSLFLFLRPKAFNLISIGVSPQTRNDECCWEKDVNATSNLATKNPLLINTANFIII